jgi:metallo-beta-lactamase family protein
MDRQGNIHPNKNRDIKAMRLIGQIENLSKTEPGKDPAFPILLHHGAVKGVTGSCHELRAGEAGILIDCGLFQGAETSPDGAGAQQLEIGFPIDHIRALVVTHVHIDHVGRIPYLMAAGFDGPILCSEPSTHLLPLVLEDAIRLGFTRQPHLIERFLHILQQRIVPVPYGRWHPIATGTASAPDLAIKLKPAGHVLGSAYVECRIRGAGVEHKVIFSGDLGAPHAPLLAAPKPPYSADIVVLESTYGDRVHTNRANRRQQLRQAIEHALADRGTVLIPAFSIGRTQELLYDLETIIHAEPRHGRQQGLPWRDLEIIVDSPLASRFTETYRALQSFWDAEARRRLAQGRKPLAFEQLTTIDNHEDHLRTVDYLSRSGRPSVVIAASGMCAGGRIVNYLKAMLGEPRNDVLFVGYQAEGTPGRAIQDYGPKGGWVELDGTRYAIRARIHRIDGYSAHADQKNLVDFIRRMRHPPRQVRLVHGEDAAKRALKEKLDALGQGIDVLIP